MHNHIITPGECKGLKLALNLLVRGSNVEHNINVGDVLLNREEVSKY